MTTITVQEGVKERLARLKPEELTWSQYLGLMADSVDETQLLGRVEALLKAEYEQSIERAMDRYHRIRSGESKTYSFDEAMERIRQMRGE